MLTPPIQWKVNKLVRATKHSVSVREDVRASFNKSKMRAHILPVRYSIWVGIEGQYYHTMSLKVVNAILDRLIRRYEND